MAWKLLVGSASRVSFESQKTL